MTADKKAEELLKEFGKEKALDIVHTMYWYAKEFRYSEWVDFWRNVKKLIKKAE